MSPAARDQSAPSRTSAHEGDSPEPTGRPKQARVVLDALGGDAPLRERVSGAANAARMYDDVRIFLAGDSEQLARELEALGGCPANVDLVHAPEAIGMHEAPVQAIRGKRSSSIVVGIEMVGKGEADAFVSAGNTGAVTAASALKLGRLEGVQRPGIAAAMQVIDHPVVAIDVGANVHCKPVHLLQYAIMADVFARELLGIQAPRVGLLNVGEEDAKGHETIRKTFELLSKADLNFIGNAEPERVFRNGCDILVCDGFVGNVLLKVSESLVMRLIGWLREQVGRSLRYKLGMALCADLFRHLKECADFSEYGGAPLLGVRGVTIITHGTSDARAIQNAIREARMFVERHVNDHIEQAVMRDAAARASNS
jgi:glycerol-3-phosphate acyltransferase PlsX